MPELKARGVEAIVVLIHEGGYPTGDYNECPAISGAIVDIVKKFDRAVDVVISGHTHQPYVCEIDGRLVTSGDKYGTIVTAIDLKLDPATRDVVSAKADNVIVRSGVLAKDPEQTALLESYDKLAAPIANRPAGSVTATLSHGPPLPAKRRSAISSPTRNWPPPERRPMARAVIAFTNPGGIRTDIVKKPGRRGELRRIVRQPAVPQPAGDADADRTARSRTRWSSNGSDPKLPRILQVSNGFSYAWDNAKPYGEHIIADRMMLNGQRIDPAASYRMTVNNYLSVGGDGFTVLKQGTAPQVGVYDADALYGYFRANSPISPTATDRIARLN